MFDHVNEYQREASSRVKRAAYPLRFNKPNQAFFWRSLEKIWTYHMCSNGRMYFTCETFTEASGAIQIDLYKKK